MRERLNVDVTVPSESPLAPSPIETFTDMVGFLYVWTLKKGIEFLSGF